MVSRLMEAPALEGPLRRRPGLWTNLGPNWGSKGDIRRVLCNSRGYREYALTPPRFGRKLSNNRKRFGGMPKAREARRGVRSSWCEAEPTEEWWTDLRPKASLSGRARRLRYRQGRKAPGARQEGEPPWGWPREVRRRKLTGYPGPLRVRGELSEAGES